MNPASVMNGPCVPSHPPPRSVDVGRRRRRKARRRTPNAARRAMPPMDPTIAGTRGTVEEEVDVGVDDAVLDDVGDPAVPVGDGTPGVGEGQVNSTVDVSPVVQVVKAVDVRFTDELNEVVHVAVGAAVREERLKKGGVVVKVGKGSAVRFEGRFEIISLGPTVGAMVSSVPVIVGSTVLVGGTSVCCVRAEDVSGEVDVTSVPSD